MSEALLEYFMHNKVLFNVSKFEEIYSDTYPSIYEVIRIIDGVPVFLEEHFERLKNSAEILGYKLNTSLEDIKKCIYDMISINHIKNYNIKIVFNNLSSDIRNEFYFFIKSSYPTKEMYESGVKAFLYRAVRHNPNAKVLNSNLRDEVNRLMHDKGCYEALLVNNKNEITEGSRSNIFFIRENTVYTAPPEDVLLGITRQRIIKLCRQNNINVIEEPIPSETLESFDAVFISGTSPKVLPISRIDSVEFSPENSLLLKIIDIYNNEIEKYISENK